MPRKTKETSEENNKNTTAKKTSKSATKKASTTKKTAVKKSTSKKSSTSKKTTKKVAKKQQNIIKPEYYDLPYRYNQTVVRLLAQTPKILFVYWDISDADRENYKKQYGENFFETTKPVLIVHNDTLNYSFEVEINDFASNWYLHVDDSKSDYRVELGRRPFIHNNSIPNDYVYVTTSNEIESPNDHILFEKSQNMIYFRNVKTNEVTSKSMSNLSFIRNMGKIYNIYDLYQKIYGDEDVLSNPSSQSSSNFI